ncbi:hypothetical protein PMAYCL1PPCAC_04996, partial [Pristionchus mayeri]
MSSDYKESDEIKEELLEFKDELFDDFTDVKQEESVFYLSPLYKENAIKKELEEFKDEPLDEFADIKQEEHSDDMVSPFTETSLPLNHSSPLAIPCDNAAESSFLCSKCGKKLGSKHTLIDHIRIHSGEKPFKCAYCDKSFRTRSNRYNHIRLVHKIKLYSCLSCGKEYDKKAELKQHLVDNK